MLSYQCPFHHNKEEKIINTSLLRWNQFFAVHLLIDYMKLIQFQINAILRYNQFLPNLQEIMILYINLIYNNR